MKNSSMNTAPNGNIPAMRILKDKWEGGTGDEINQTLKRETSTLDFGKNRHTTLQPQFSEVTCTAATDIFYNLSIFKN